LRKSWISRRRIGCLPRRDCVCRRGGRALRGPAAGALADSRGSLGARRMQEAFDDDLAWWERSTPN
jgi:hypothetical protein